MYKIVCYERENTGMFKCEIAFYETSYDNMYGKAIIRLVPGANKVIYLSEPEVNFHLWKQSMIEQGKLTLDDIHLLDNYVDSVIKHHINLNTGE